MESIIPNDVYDSIYIEAQPRFAQGGIITPISGETVQIKTTVPKVVEKRIYSNGKVRLDVYVLEDGTIHVDPDAFEYMLQEIGFLSREEAVVDHE